MIQKTLKTDIIIAGAGLVGLSFALAMRTCGASIHLLETHLPQLITQPAENTRPISLSFGSVRILKALGVWDALKDNASPILNVHVSQEKHFGVTHFSAVTENVPALGYVVSFAALQSALYHAVTASHATTLTAITSIQNIQCDPQGAAITVKTSRGESTLHANLFIAADGTHSTCRDLLGITHTTKNHGDIARIDQLELSENHTHTAYERFTPYGVLAVLPLPEKHKAQLVWTLTPRIAEKISAWDNAAVLAFLQRTFEGRLAIASIRAITQFPLQTVIAEKQIAPSAVLLGNAAHTLYPVAAQGFNLGLQDAILLSDLLSDVDKRFNDPAVLKKYEAQANRYQQKIFCITNQLIALFDLPMIGALRGLGLLATDLLTPIKNKFAKRTMGIAEKLPRLLQRVAHE